MRLLPRFASTSFAAALLLAVLCAAVGFGLALHGLEQDYRNRLDSLRAGLLTAQEQGGEGDPVAALKAREPDLVFAAWLEDEGPNRLAGRWPEVRDRLAGGAKVWSGPLRLERRELLATVFPWPGQPAGYQLLGFSRDLIWQGALRQTLPVVLITLAALLVFWLWQLVLVRRQIGRPMARIETLLDGLCAGETPDHIRLGAAEEFNEVAMAALRLGERLDRARRAAAAAEKTRTDSAPASARERRTVEALTAMLRKALGDGRPEALLSPLPDLLAPSRLVATEIRLADGEIYYRQDPDGVLDSPAEVTAAGWHPLAGFQRLVRLLGAEEEPLGSLVLVAEGEALPKPEWLEPVAGMLALWLAGRLVARRAQRSEARLGALVDQVADGVLVHDERGRILRVNEALAGLSGYSREELLRLRVDALLVKPERVVDVSDAETDDVLIQKGGRRIPVELRRRPLEEDGQRLEVVTLRDLSEQLQRERTVRLLSQVVEQSPVAVMITDLEGVIEYVNRRFCDDSGYPATEVIGQHSRILQSGLTPPETYRQMWGRICQGLSWQGEICNKTRDGRLIWERMLISPVFSGGRIAHFMALKENLTREREQQRRLFEQIRFDRLTGLPNRSQALDALENRIETLDAQPQALLVLDVDHFRQVNESLGHGAGDQLLVAVVERLRDAFRGTDTLLARLGGDEFALVAPLEGQPPERWAARVRAPFKAPLRVDDRPVFVSFGIGIACWPDDATDAMSLLRQAEAALNLAKSGGSGRTERYRAALAERAEERLKLETELRFALENDEFFLQYQPQVAADGRVLGAEAVLRWDNPRLGPVSPERFIPIAEHLGLIDAIGDWILQRACSDAAGWLEDPLMPRFVAVNLSARQLLQGADLVRRLEEILALTGLPASALELEITEGLLMDQGEATLAALKSLKRMGIRLALDDFGTGYSALSYLQKYPFDALKIDRSFIEPIGRDADGENLLRAIVSMGKSLSLQLVAEGVETEEQLEFVRGLGVDLVQGYYYAPPIHAARMKTAMELHHARFMADGAL